MATRRRTKGGGSQVFNVAVETEGIKETIGAFNKLRLSEQLVAYRKAANKSVRAVKKTMKALVPKGRGIDPRGNKRPHLRDSLAVNVKTLGRGDSRFVSGIVGADYKKVPTIHLLNNPVKPHKIKAKEKRALSDERTGGDDINTTFFGKEINHPGFEGLGFMQQAANANETAVRDYYVDAIREAVNRSRVSGSK